MLADFLADAFLARWSSFGHTMADCDCFSLSFVSKLCEHFLHRSVFERMIDLHDGHCLRPLPGQHSNLIPTLRSLSSSQALIISFIWTKYAGFIFAVKPFNQRLRELTPMPSCLHSVFCVTLVSMILALH